MHTPWNIPPWTEVKRSLEMIPLDDVEYPTIVSACQNIADWDAALQHKTVDLNVSDERGMNGFHYAARRGNLNLVKYLISRNADIHKVTNDARGASALHLAVESGDMATLQFLVGKGLAIEGKDSSGETAIHVACRTGRLVQLSYLLRSNPNVVDIQDAEGRTPLHTAILLGSYNCMKQILFHHPNVFLFDQTGLLPIHQTLKTSNPHALMLLAEYDFSQFSKLTKSGDRLLSLALESGDETIIKVVRQYASMSNFPSWFKIYMWHFSSASWVFIFLFASLFINFWILLAVSIFGLRTLYTLTQSEHFKTSKNPIISSGALALSGAGLVAYFYWIFSFASTQHPFLAIMLIPAAAITLELYRRLYFRDPGYHIYSAEDTIKFSLEAKNEPPLPSLCETCLGDRPIRTKHCSKCERCIEDAQHHCSVLNICVGKNTRGTFVAFLASAIITLLIWLTFAIPYMGFIVPDEITLNWWNVYATFRVFADLNCALTILTILALSAFFYAIFMLGIHIKLIALNLTAYESAHWERYNMVDEKGEFYNPNDKGISQNFRDFIESWFGTQRADSAKVV
jgi:ankyrin repeat protein